MKGQSIYSGNLKRIAVVAVVGFAAAALFYKLDGGAGTRVRPAKRGGLGCVAGITPGPAVWLADRAGVCL